MTDNTSRASYLPFINTIITEAIIMGAVKDHQFAPVLDVIEGRKTIYQAEKAYELVPNTLGRIVNKTRKRIEAYEKWSTSQGTDGITFKRVP